MVMIDHVDLGDFPVFGLVWQSDRNDDNWNSFVISSSLMKALSINVRWLFSVKTGWRVYNSAAGLIAGEQLCSMILNAVTCGNPDSGAIKLNRPRVP